MTESPYVFEGFVYDIDNSTVVSGAAVTARNSTGETISTTSNSEGFVLNLQNLTYSNGEKIILTFTSGRKFYEIVKTVNTANAGETFNATLGFQDVVDACLFILEDNWTAANTDYITPTFDKKFNIKRTDDLKNAALIVAYKLPELRSANGFGTSSFEARRPVTIEMRTAKSRQHINRLLKEVMRILNLKITNPDYTHTVLESDGKQIRDFSDEKIGFFRYSVECEFVNYNESR